MLDGDELLYIIVKHRHELGTLKGGVVGTVMSNLGLEMAIRKMGVEFLRVPVGDRHIMAELTKRKWHLGGEPSGHIICSDASTTGDGIITALQVLSILRQKNKSLAELKKGLNSFPQVLVNVKVKENVDPSTNSRVAAVLHEAENSLGKMGRILLRRSGTEPLIRVMVEGENEKQVNELAHQIAAVVKEEFA